MSDTTTCWELRKGAIVLGTLCAHSWDFPWLDNDFEPTAAFEAYRALFAGDFHLLQAPDSDVADWEWEDAYRKVITAGIALVPVDAAARRLQADLLSAEGETADWLRPILGG